ncbi:hypothetical protein RB594_009126 [Gaeumannomyces avenae]
MSAASQAVLQPSSAIQTNPHPSAVVPFPDSTSEASTPKPSAAGENDDGKKKKKRSLFGFGKKKAEDPQTAATAAAPAANTSAPRESPSRRTTGSPGRVPTSPVRSTSPHLSPRLASPAGSQIFERDVQESAVALPTSPAIPSHITTEDFIPPVLDASSEAITDDRIDPDTVEIVTHSLHQPAGAAVTGSQQLSQSSSIYDQGGAGAAASWAEQLASFEHAGPATGMGGDSASNYGSLDATDVRRLSFISFADVVQSEQGHGHGPGPSASRDSMHLAGLTSLSALGGSSGAGARSPSPIRSPVSSQGGGMSSSPPTSKSGSIRGLETSPTRKPLTLTATGGPLSPGSPPSGMVLGDGELKIETMSQALRRTGSTDLSGIRSLPHSPIDGPLR